MKRILRVGLLALLLLIYRPVIMAATERDGGFEASVHSGLQQYTTHRNDADDILKCLYDPADERIQICAHRGVSEKLPENGIGNLLRSIDHGFDIIEIDLSVTKDGAIILMHDKTLDRTTTGKGLVSEHTLKEIKSLYLRDIDGNVTGEKVPTLEEVLELAGGKVLLQMDKWQGLLDKVLPILEEYGCLQYAIFRSTMPYDKIKTAFGDYLDKVIYIPVIPCGRSNSEQLLTGYLKNMPEIPVICFVFGKEDDLDLTMVSKLKSKYRIWFNAIADKDSANHGDRQALEGDLAGSYGWLVSNGGNIIFSDRAILLDNYLKGIGRR